MTDLYDQNLFAHYFLLVFIPALWPTFPWIYFLYLCDISRSWDQMSRQMASGHRNPQLPEDPSPFSSSKLFSLDEFLEKANILAWTQLVSEKGDNLERSYLYFPYFKATIQRSEATPQSNTVLIFSILRFPICVTYSWLYIYWSACKHTFSSNSFCMWQQAGDGIKEISKLFGVQMISSDN